MGKNTYHFKGPVAGPVALVIGLPLTCYLLVYCSNEQVGTHQHTIMSPNHIYIAG